MSLFQSFLNSHNFISTVGRHRKTAKAKDTSLVTKDGPGLEMLVKFFLFFLKKKLSYNLFRAGTYPTWWDEFTQNEKQFRHPGYQCLFHLCPKSTFMGLPISVYGLKDTF